MSTTPNNNLYDGAFSRSGTFERDYNGIASADGYSYITRYEAHPAFAGEPVALTPDPSVTDGLQLANKGHQHQETWVAVVGPAATSSQVQAAATAPTSTAPQAAAPATLPAAPPNTAPPGSAASPPLEH